MDKLGNTGFHSSPFSHLSVNLFLAPWGGRRNKSAPRRKPYTQSRQAPHASTQLTSRQRSDTSCGRGRTDTSAQGLSIPMGFILQILLTFEARACLPFPQAPLPPSMVRLAPVIMGQSAENKKAHAAATSCGRPMRPTGNEACVESGDRIARCVSSSTSSMLQDGKRRMRWL